MKEKQQPLVKECFYFSEIPDAVTPPPRPPRGRPVAEGPSYKNTPAESAQRSSASPAVSQSPHAPPRLPPHPAVSLDEVLYQAATYNYLIGVR